MVADCKEAVLILWTLQFSGCTRELTEVGTACTEPKAEQIPNADKVDSVPPLAMELLATASCQEEERQFLLS